MSIGKPTHPSTYPSKECWNRRGGQYKPRTGNSHGSAKEKSKGNVKTANAARPVYVPGTVVPSWAKKYAVRNDT